MLIQIQCLQGTADIKTIKSTILEKFKTLIDSSQLIMRDDLFLNARDLSPEARDTLRKVIVEYGETYPDYGKNMPKHWMELLETLFQMKTNGQRIISLECLIDVNAGLKNPLRKEELELFLTFMHNAGYLLHFKDAGLQNMVILDPKLIIDAMKCFITCRKFSFDIWGGRRWNKMVSTGKIEKSHIINMWVKRNKELYFENKEFLLGVMEKLDLITCPKIYDKGQDVIASFYLVPSMIKETAQNRQRIRTNDVEVFFKFHDILPPAVFNRLVCSCLSLWPVHKGRLYDGYVELESGLNHLLIIRRDFKTIEVSFIHKTSPDDIDVNLCRSIKQYIRQAILRIVSLYDNAFSDGEGELYTLDYNDNARRKHLDEVIPYSFHSNSMTLLEDSSWFQVNNLRNSRTAKQFSCVVSCCPSICLSVCVSDVNILFNLCV